MSVYDSSRKVSVIVAEDDPANRRVLCRMLDRIGCEITRAINGVQAVKYATDLDAEVVFMDLAMPDMDGYEAVRAIRAEPSLSRIRVIAVTGDVTSSGRAECERAGFDAVLTKPVQMEDLAKVISSGSSYRQTT